MSSSQRKKIDSVPETNSPPRPTSGVLDEHSSTEKWSVSRALKSLPQSAIPPPQARSPVPFFHLLERLKTTKREGWRRFQLNHGESIADHMYRMSIITMFAPQSISSRLDNTKCTKMALVHDMAELLVGDITPVDNVAKSEKSRRESDTMDYLCQNLLSGVEEGRQGHEIRELWQEYEDSQTFESKFVHDVDKVELLLQMVEYERSREGQLDLGEFERVAKKVELAEVQAWCSEILAERKAFWESIGTEPSHGQNIGKAEEAMHDKYYAKPGHQQIEGGL